MEYRRCQPPCARSVLPCSVRTPCRPPVSPALHSPSTRTRMQRALLRGGGCRCYQAFSTPHIRYVFLCTTLCFLYRISFTNGSVYRGYRFGFSARFGSATHFSLGKIPPRFDGVQLTVVNSASKASVLQLELSSLLQKGLDRGNTAVGHRTRVLQPLLPRSKEGWRSEAHSGSTAFEFFPLQREV